MFERRAWRVTGILPPLSTSTDPLFGQCRSSWSIVFPVHKILECPTSPSGVESPGLPRTNRHGTEGEVQACGKMNVKQPVKSLLVINVSSTSVFQLGLILHLSLQLTAVSLKLKQVVEALMLFVVRISIPTSMWLNIFYCSQIVPVKKAPLVWLNKNIKFTICFLLTFGNIYCFVYLILQFLFVFDVFSFLDSAEVNSTVVNGSYASSSPTFQISPFLDMLDTLTMVLTLLCLSVMLTVTGATGCYLYQHIKKMTNSGTPFQSQLLQNQVRVTITGFIQGFLYLLCSAGMFIDVYCCYQKINIDREIIWMLFDLYSLATTINIGVGQAVFRQGVIQLCRRTGCLPSA
ncbi:hypothetical protein NFI96_000622 [Prochilodus magdalenae]|nr:hypothetical protein NFI96_000622 [Prochilodus magdalenae]